MGTQIDFDERLKQEATKDYAISVLRQLEQLSGLGKETHTRWIWELLQNARDASIDADNQLIISVSYNSDKELEFLHNGRAFTVDEVMRLIFPGSTKYENKGTIGRFGTGFLTTHRLSPNIKVSGKLEETDQWFQFQIVRKKGALVDTTQKSMHKAWKDFQDSLSHSVPIPEEFTTRFIYPINEETVEETVTAEDAVEAGIRTLKQFAPFVVISNREFTSIKIANQDEKLCYKVDKSHSYMDSDIQLFTVTDGKSEIKKALLVADDNSPTREKTSVIAALKFNENDVECLEIKDMPRLFLGLPLVGTETFTFPTVINSLAFEAKADRDDILPDSNKNKEIIENACPLLVRLLQFAASNGWSHIYKWVKMPLILEKRWLDSEWLKTCIEENLITEIIKTPIVLNGGNNPIPPNEAMLPIASDDINIEYLWELLSQCQEFRSKLPRQQEVAGWCKILKSWEGVCGGDISELSEAIIDGSKLVEIVENKWDFLEELQSELEEDVWAIDWLDKLYSFLKSSELFDDDIRGFPIFPNQNGAFYKLTDLYRDKDIDTELKDIAELLDWRIRSELRDTRLSSIENEVGAGDMDNGDVVQKLIDKLRKLSNENLNEGFKKASVRLFAWLVSQNDYFHLANYPTFAADGKTVLELPSSNSTATPPLAPVPAWQAELQKYYDLFPAGCIMNKTFFEALPNKEAWKLLNNENLITLHIITNSKTRDLSELAPSVYENEDENEGDQDHYANEPMPVTDIVERTEIMHEIQNSRERGYLFWQFLTEWLVKEDSSGINIKQTSCSCGKDHEYYSAKWFKAVRKNKWIREGEPRRPPNAEALGKLLREKKWELDALENPAIIQLIEALGVRPIDLQFAVIAENEEKRNEVVGLATKLYQDLEVDEGLPQLLEDRRNHIRKWRQNQNIGKKVEDLVRDSLKAEGFSVTRVNIGADFKIMLETGTLATFNIDKVDQSWLVEVKSTRNDSGSTSVRMSIVQAKTAREEKRRFLLCVVPLGQENTPDLETVRQKMLFIQNIGERVTPLCENYESLEELRSDSSNGLSDVELIVEEGNAGIRVKKAVWENDGFRLEQLIERLK